MLIDLYGKKGVPSKEKRSKSLVLPEKNACYVLITCGEPSEDGKIAVEMTYEGDAVLAAYLLESAQWQFEPQDESGP